MIQKTLIHLIVERYDGGASFERVVLLPFKPAAGDRIGLAELGDEEPKAIAEGENSPFWNLQTEQWEIVIFEDWHGEGPGISHDVTEYIKLGWTHIDGCDWKPHSEESVNWELCSSETP